MEYPICKKYKKQSSAFVPPHPIHSQNKNELFADLRFYHPLIKRDKNKKKNMTRQEMCNMLYRFYDEPKLVLSNTRNSCFIDAFFVCLFFNRIVMLDWLYRHIFQKKFSKRDRYFQKEMSRELLHLFTYMYRPWDMSIDTLSDKTEHASVKNVRDIFQKFQKHHKSFTHLKLCTQNDPDELLSMFLTFFEIQDEVKIYADGLSYQNAPINVFRILPSAFFEIKQNASSSATTLSPSYVFPKMQVTERESMYYIDGQSDILYIPVHRSIVDEKITDPVEIEDHLHVPWSSPRHPTFALFAMIVHLGSNPLSGHYIAIVKGEDTQWYMYDDLKRKQDAFQPVSLHDVFSPRSKFNKMLQRNVVSFFYHRLHYRT